MTRAQLPRWWSGLYSPRHAAAAIAPSSFLCLRQADEAHRSRTRARRNGRGRSRAAQRRRLAHLDRCAWCLS